MPWVILIAKWRRGIVWVCDRDSGVQPGCVGGQCGGGALVQVELGGCHGDFNGQAILRGCENVCC